mmetsp:Transcript_35543/g.31367  ORF Transcript_35543/g.31367 Transcript_35543/m.31367 type:complete len:198 (-) Transcript_35543:3-596(-)
MGCNGKAIVGCVFGILGIVAYIVGVGVNEITRTNSVLGSSWCGWDGIGACGGTDCEDALFMYNLDGTTYTEGAWDDLCDACELIGQDDCGPCKNKIAGKIWFGAIISGIILGALGILFLIIPSTRGFGGGLLALACGCGIIGVAGFIGLTYSEEVFACFNQEIDPAPVLAGSIYAVIVGMVCLLIGGIASCGAGKYD